MGGREDSGESGGRNWLPLIVASVLVGGVIWAGLTFTSRSDGSGNGPVLSPVNSALDVYAPNLPLTQIAMSEAEIPAGGKVTYLDGHVANEGDRVVKGITVQVLFRNVAGEVVQNETVPMALIRMREPYIDTEAVSVAPLKAGAQQDFRLIFEKISADWSQAVPEVRILRVEFE